MHELEILGSLIPEFAPLTCLVQHEFYHRYTADEHTLVCIEQLDRVLQDEAEPYVKYRKIFLGCDKPEILYLALILHDVGKAGNSGDHSQLSTQLAVRFGRRMRLKGRDLQNLSFLVDHHMTLTEFAQRRNLEDPKTIRDFARIVQDKERLDMLMLMSFADVQGIGDSSWSNWKEGLVWTLYLSTVEVLEDEVEFLRKAEVARKDLKKRVIQHLSQQIDPGEYEAHFAALPPSYFSHASEERIVQDIQLVHEFFVRQLAPDVNPLIPVIRWEDQLLKDHTEVGVVTWDRDRLFTKIVGSFAVAGLNILSADIWTREDHIVIDTFRVCTNQLSAVTHKLDRQHFEKALASSLTDQDYDLGREVQRLRTTKKLPVEEDVVTLALGLDNESSEQYTLLHVRATDRIGILYSISQALADNKVSIVYARITTEKGAALDTFYLVDAEGRKISDQAQQKRLLKSLNQELQPVS
jgi:[protein-PII] uridylyltransferase